MNLVDLVGTWELIGTVSWSMDAAEVATITTDLGRERVVHQWLRGERMEGQPPVTPVEGLRLDIDDAAVLTERLTVDEARCAWFDADGLLQPQAAPFNGVVLVEGDAGHVLLDEATIDTDDPDEDSAKSPKGVVLRVDDPDVQISDRLTTNSNGLTRVVSAVTNGEHFNRSVCYYRRYRD